MRRDRTVKNMRRRLARRDTCGRRGAVPMSIGLAIEVIAAKRQLFAALSHAVYAVAETSHALSA